MYEKPIGVKDWVNIRRRFSKTKSAGAHVYISSNVLLEALGFADIPENAELKARRYAMNSKRKGLARITLDIKER